MPSSMLLLLITFDAGCVVAKVWFVCEICTNRFECICNYEGIRAMDLMRIGQQKENIGRSGRI